MSPRDDKRNVNPTLMIIATALRLWAISEAEDSLKKHIVIPELRLRGAMGNGYVAKNAVIFRVDNLEGESIGQALLIRDLSSS